VLKIRLTNVSKPRSARPDDFWPQIWTNKIARSPVVGQNQKKILLNNHGVDSAE
jgi:hypothetical protein